MATEKECIDFMDLYRDSLLSMVEDGLGLISFGMEVPDEDSEEDGFRIVYRLDSKKYVHGALVEIACKHSAGNVDFLVKFEEKS